jgi:diguanylate cyclase (GGDEF)-like protein
MTTRSRKVSRSPAAKAPAAKRRAVAPRGHAERALRTLSAGNRTLLRASDEEALLQQMCAVIVEQGGYPAAWVGYAQHDEAKHVRVMAAAGIDRAILDAMDFTWAESGIGLGPTGTTIRTGTAAIGRNLRTDPKIAKIRKDILRRGFPDYGASSVFPLRIDDTVLGNLTIYAPEADAFDEAEVQLLAELADDLAYGIANLRTRAKQRAAEATIQRMAFHDSVTGLPNRTWLRERLEAAIARARQQHRPLALLVLRVEQYDDISDTLGYHEGELLLVELARRLHEILHDEELLARGGEDEFIVLLPGSGADEASDKARVLIRALYEPIELSGVTVSTRASVGIALSPGHGNEPDRLIRCATVAANAARRSAGGYAVYAGSLDRDCTRRLALMSDLRHAIEHDGLELYCQPKVCIRSHRLCGAEALVRWTHPQLGAIATGEFIKLAEHTGLIGALTRWVLDAAFSHSYAWHEAGLAQPLAINLSAHDLRDPRLLDRIKGLFTTWGVQPEWIQFELTESTLMEDPAGALDTLTRLKQLGVELYIDDFGTGYSSLAYLQKLPVDSIKIDQSFVADMVDNGDAGIIVRSTIELGHNLALGVVAEGVENERTWKNLDQLGCDTAQGYFVSEPIPAERFRAWQRASPWHTNSGAARH